MKTMNIALALAVAAVAATACDNDPKIGPQPKPEPTPEAGTDVRVITTTGSRSFDLTESTIGFSSRDNMSPSSIYLLPQGE